MVKLVIFDFDGTLADSKEASISIYNRLAQKYNTKLIDNIDNIRRLPLLERFMALGIPIYKLPFLAADFTKQYKSFLKNISLVTGMKELLIELKRQGYELAIVSSNSESNIREFLRENFLDMIGTIVNSANIMGKDKVIQKLLTTIGLNPLEVLYVGDEIRDITACKKLGIKIIWVDWGYDLFEMAKDGQPDYVAGSPQDILPILASL